VSVVEADCDDVNERVEAEAEVLGVAAVVMDLNKKDFLYIIFPIRCAN
jgi:hypothetical protein